MIKHLTIFEIKNYKNYVLFGSFNPKECGRIIRKHKKNILTTDNIENFCSEYARKNKTQLIVKRYECKQVA